MSSVNQALIPFHGSELVTIQDEQGQIWVALKPVCEHLGMEWSSQHRRVSTSEDFNHVLMTIVAKDGKSRQMMCLPQEQLLGWLFTINSNKVNPEVKPILKAYKAETTAAINDYWTKGVATRDTGEPTIDMSDPLVVAQLYVESETDRRRLMKENKLAHQEIELARPKVEAYHDLIAADGSMLVRDVCKVIRGCPFGQNKMYEFLREQGHIMKGSTKPYQRVVDAGYYIERAQSTQIGTSTRAVATTYVTMRGLEAIRDLLVKEGHIHGMPTFNFEWGIWA